MSWMPRGVRRAFRMDRWTGAQVDKELDEEFLFHLEMRETELRESGWTPDAARHEALRRFGDLADARRYCRQLDGERARTGRRRDRAQGWGQDVRFAARQLRRAPTLALVAVLTLSLGIGATTAIFSVVHRLMLAPLPYPEADRIVSVVQAAAQGGIRVSANPPLVEAWRAGSNAFEQLGMFAEDELEHPGVAGMERLDGVRLSGEMPAVLGVRPALGRFFLPEETRAGGAPVAMLGYGYWQRAHGGRADVVGQPITLDGQPHTVVGVLPRDFVLPAFSPISGKQVALPFVPDTNVRNVFAVGRLRPGVTREAAAAQLTGVMTRLAEDDPHYRDMVVQVMRQEEFLGEKTRQTLLVLLGAVGVVLLVACANVAGLLLARAAARQRELAVRAALGAGRARLVRQLLTESALLGVLGAAGGVAVAWLGLQAMIALRPPSLDELAAVRLDPAVLGVSVAIALATSLAFGLAPAVLGAASGVRASLVGSSRSATAHRGAQRLRAALVGGEVALSVVLLVCAGLLVRSVAVLASEDVGFDARNLAGTTVLLPRERYTTDGDRAAAYARVLEHVRALPGVTAATLGDVPPDGGVTFGTMEVDGLAELPGTPPSILGYAQVAPDYFRVIGTPLVAGRVPDGSNSSEVAINERFARRYWPDGGAVGGRFRLGADHPWWTVTGVVGDVHRPGSTSTANELRLYVPVTGTFESSGLIVRTAGAAPTLQTDLARAAAEVGPGITIRELRTAEDQIARQIAGPRFSMSLLAVFAAIALVLATVGLYGVISLAVTQRTREIGVRMALGASPRGVTGMVVQQAMLLAGGGVLVGLVASVGAVRLVRGMLYGVEPLDPPAFAAAAATLSVVALVAALVPARRAARVDAMEALRAE